MSFLKNLGKKKVRFDFHVFFCDLVNLPASEDGAALQCQLKRKDKTVQTSLGLVSHSSVDWSESASFFSSLYVADKRTQTYDAKVFTLTIKGVGNGNDKWRFSLDLATIANITSGPNATAPGYVESELYITFDETHHSNVLSATVSSSAAANGRVVTAAEASTLSTPVLKLLVRAFAESAAEDVKARAPFRGHGSSPTGYQGQGAGLGSGMGMAMGMSEGAFSPASDTHPGFSPRSGPRTGSFRATAGPSEPSQLGQPHSTGAGVPRTGSRMSSRGSESQSTAATASTTAGAGGAGGVGGAISPGTSSRRLASPPPGASASATTTAAAAAGGTGAGASAGAGAGVGGSAAVDEAGGLTSSSGTSGVVHNRKVSLYFTQVMADSAAADDDAAAAGVNAGVGGSSAGLRQYRTLNSRQKPGANQAHMGTWPRQGQGQSQGQGQGQGQGQSHAAAAAAATAAAAARAGGEGNDSSYHPSNGAGTAGAAAGGDAGPTSPHGDPYSSGSTPTAATSTSRQSSQRSYRQAQLPHVRLMSVLGTEQIQQTSAAAAAAGGGGVCGGMSGGVGAGAGGAGVGEDGDVFVVVDCDMSPAATRGRLASLDIGAGPRSGAAGLTMGAGAGGLGSVDVDVDDNGSDGRSLLSPVAGTSRLAVDHDDDDDDGNGGGMGMGGNGAGGGRGARARSRAGAGAGAGAGIGGSGEVGGEDDGEPTIWDAPRTGGAVGGGRRRGFSQFFKELAEEQ